MCEKNQSKNDFLPCLPDGTVDPTALNDEPEGERVPSGVTVIDCHTHLFPAGVFQALWRWFDAHAWNIRYRFEAEKVVEYLVNRGVKKMCALHYSHKPGMAEYLNSFVGEIAKGNPEVIPFATVLPGEPDAKKILHTAFSVHGARGVKIHCHVQKMAADDPRLEEVYQACEEADRALIIHSGREPSISAYGVDTRALCHVSATERVLQRHPKLKIIVAHLGADEFIEHQELLDKYDNLYLDTTMAIGDYFRVGPPTSLFPGRCERLLYGSDFPNIPYAWDRELKKVLASIEAGPNRDLFLFGNATRLFE